MRPFRFIYSGASNGFVNMAMDEAVLTELQHKRSTPLLRIYKWIPPTITIGYFQPARDIDFDRCREDGIGIVRRLTGGRAVLHNEELTYSILFTNEDFQPFRKKELFTFIARCLLDSLKSLGISSRIAEKSRGDLKSADCFAAPAQFEIEATEGKPPWEKNNPGEGKPPWGKDNPGEGKPPWGKDNPGEGKPPWGKNNPGEGKPPWGKNNPGEGKLIGSAQVIKDGVVLQHGAIPLTGSYTAISKYLKGVGGSAKNASSLHRASGLKIGEHDLLRALKQGFGGHLRLEEGAFTGREEEKTLTLAKEKYPSDEWMFLR